MERATLSVGRGLLDHGLDVDLVLETKTGGFLDEIDSRIALFDLQRGTKPGAYAALLRHWPVFALEQIARVLSRRLDYLPVKRLLSLVAYLSARRPDVLFVSHGRLPILAILAKRIAGVSSSVVIIEHSTLSRWVEAFAHEPDKQAKWIYRVALARRFYRHATRVVGVSNGVTADLARLLDLPDEKMQTLYNPVGAPAPVSLTAPAHPWFHQRDKQPLILAVGRLVAEKNFRLLIDAFASLQAARPARLLILGEGAERVALERRIDEHGLADHVALAGWCNAPQAAMAHADLFVLSSWFEGLGLVLIEAMAVGCPVVSVDCPSGPREILDEGRYGRLVPMDDPAALAAAMEATLDSQVPAAALRARAADFSVDRSIDRYMALIETLAPVGSREEAP